MTKMANLTDELRKFSNCLGHRMKNIILEQLLRNVGI
jgi:hypothetical protein